MNFAGGLAAPFPCDSGIRFFSAEMGEKYCPHGHGGLVLGRMIFNASIIAEIV